MSYAQPNARPYASHAYANAQPVGQSLRRFPLPNHCPIQFAAYAFDQPFQQAAASFPPAPKNTPSNASSGATFGLADANAILTSFSQPSFINATLAEYTGTFNIVPASWDDFSTQSVTFPGIRETAYIGGVRDPKTVNTTVRTRRDYFVIDPAAVLSGVTVTDSGGTNIVKYTSRGLIPILYRTPWKFLVSGTVLATSEVTSLVKSGGITGWLETRPNTGDYQGWIATAAAAVPSGAWTASVPPIWDGASSGTTPGQFQFADSRLEDYAGNIVCRVSEFALAQ